MFAPRCKSIGPTIHPGPDHPGRPTPTASKQHRLRPPPL